MRLPLTGGCNCGAVRYEVTEPLVRASYCHCKRCQRRTGTAASAQAHPAPGAFRIVAGEALDLAALRAHLFHSLPDYARPVFLRVRSALDVTGTFKHTKSTLVREGYDPGAIRDAMYFSDRERQTFVRLDQSLYEHIQSGQVRV